MDPLIIGVLIVTLVVGWLLYKSKPAAQFVVEIQAGVARAKDGKVTEAFLNELTEQCREAGIRTGEVRGLPRGPRIGLWFSPEFPAEVCQRLRNWWGMNGWLVVPRSSQRRK
ncbi:hypothetical protein ETAA8_58820 [Anatilimnocola aggregata]|uniref:DUF3634 family protein n=1 Tax=Anatilimnocola aggregata TaxID=2528021 RepID=A0A517YKJ5_9BACT|nr:DUF3634 family protein [Anatilimnocola aggregata]QDU30734.1 hypothetical protein ETAA8_58820 [Anatilimnocola aggregata]